MSSMDEYERVKKEVMGMTNVFDILQERGFIEQITHEEEVKELLAKESVTFLYRV